MRRLLVIFGLLLAPLAHAGWVEVINCANGNSYLMSDPRPRVKSTIEYWKTEDTFFGVVVEGNADDLANGFFETGGFESRDWANVEASEPVRAIYGVGGRRACLVMRGFRTR